jgi:hypothetical protein
VKNQSSLSHIGQPHTVLLQPEVANGHRFITRRAIHSQHINLCTSTNGVRDDARATANEPHPIRTRAQRPLEPSRRHLEHVPITENLRLVESSFDRARRCCAVVDLHRHSVLPVNANVDHLPRSRPANTQIG